jgi:hypothetical protein
MKRTVLKWRNKFSGEEGYVGKVSKKNGCFINTFNPAEAKRYTNRKSIDNDLVVLAELGETVNNDFFVCEVTVA